LQSKFQDQNIRKETKTDPKDYFSNTLFVRLLCKASRELG